ncbi:hypothetical protein ACVDFE_23050 [Lentzea chajnantorensis]
MRRAAPYALVVLVVLVAVVVVVRDPPGIAGTPAVAAVPARTTGAPTR